MAAAACDRLGLPLVRVALDGIGGALEERELVRLVEREALLDGAALFIDGDTAEASGDLLRLARRLAERVIAPVVLTTRDRGRALARPSIAIAVGRPTMAEQQALFRDALASEQLDDRADAARGVDRAVS